MARIVVVTGTPGAGKTTVIAESKKSSRNQLVSVGGVMEEIGLEKGYVVDRDEIRKLDNAKISELRKEALRRISQMDGDIIVDTHASIARRRRYIPGFPFEALEHMNKIIGFIYIDSSAEDIILRRSLDKTRSREVESRDEINDQRTINLSMLSYYASYLNIPLYIIENKQSDIRGTLEDFTEDLRELFGGNNEQ